MARKILLRLLGAIPVLLLVAVAIFALLRLAPGDAATLLAPENASDADIARLRTQWGLDQPLPLQLGHFLVNLFRLDLGNSYRYGEPVAQLVFSRLPATLELALAALVLAVAVAVPLGVLTALKRGGPLDALGSLFAVAGVSAPSFWVGILLVLLFSAQLNWLPSGGRLPFGAPLELRTGFLLIDSLSEGQFATFLLVLKHLALPAVTLALGMIGIIARITRSAVIEAEQEEFVTTALAKGLGSWPILRRHILPNAAIPIATIIGLELGALVSGSIIVEVIFDWPGIGTLLYQAISVRDVPLILGVVAVYTTLFILLNLAIDLAYLAIDPRLRAGGGA